MPLEIELKLIASPDVLARVAKHPAVRAVKAGRARTEPLLSRYFDTPDRRLQRARIALRVRRTPRGWVQTVKTEGETAHERPEWEWPATDGVPRGDVLGETPALKALGGLKRLSLTLASLEPVFETDIRRSIYPLRFADGTTAELCLDSGEVRAWPGGNPGSEPRTEQISEVEIELKSGDPARLFELALALADALPLRLGHASKAARGNALAAHDPARTAPQKATDVSLREDMGVMAAFRAIASSCIGHMQSNEAGLLKGRDPEYLHQMRVAVRRLRSALRIFRDVIDPALFAPVAEEMRALARALGAARDWDVFCADLLRPAGQSFPQHAGMAALLRRAQRARRANDREARMAVAGSRYTRGMLELARLSASGVQAARPGTGAPDPAAADAPPPDAGISLKGFAAQALQKSSRRVRKLGRRLAELSTDELHQLRINAKKLRYVAEFFEDLFPGRKARAHARALSDLQDVLGALNDFAVGLRLLEELARPPRADKVRGPAEVEAVAMLHGWLGAERRRRLQSLPKVWTAFEEHARYWKSNLPGDPSAAPPDAPQDVPGAPAAGAMPKT